MGPIILLETGSGAHNPGGPRSEGGKGRERRWRRSPSEPGGPRRPQTPVRQATVWPPPRRAHSSWERLEMQMRHAGLPGGKAAAAPRHVRVNRPRRCFCGAADRKAEAGGAEGPVRRADRAPAAPPAGLITAARGGRGGRRESRGQRCEHGERGGPEGCGRAPTRAPPGAGRAR